MTETSMINVLIKDGDRTVNWDYFPDKPVADIVYENGFDPIPGSVRIGGEPVPRDVRWYLSDCPQVVSPDGKQMRVVITMRPKRKKPEAKKEGTAYAR